MWSFKSLKTSFQGQIVAYERKKKKQLGGVQMEILYFYQVKMIKKIFLSFVGILEEVFFRILYKILFLRVGGILLSVSSGFISPVSHSNIKLTWRRQPVTVGHVRRLLASGRE